MRAIAQEKYDHADTAFWMYENALRKTDKIMDDLKPDDVNIKSEYGSSKWPGVRQAFQNLDIEEEEKQKLPRPRSKNKKKLAQSQKTEIKMEPIFKEQEAYNIQDLQQIGGDEVVTCPCGEIKNDDWVGCDMHEKWEHEWFHLRCVKLEALPPDSQLWFCDGCRKKYKSEIAQKEKEAMTNKK